MVLIIFSLTAVISEAVGYSRSEATAMACSVSVFVGAFREIQLWLRLYDLSRAMRTILKSDLVCRGISVLLEMALADAARQLAGTLSNNPQWIHRKVAFSRLHNSVSDFIGFTKLPMKMKTKDHREYIHSGGHFGGSDAA